MPEGWTTAAPREEISPAFAYEPNGGTDGKGSFVITAAAREGTPLPAEAEAIARRAYLAARLGFWLSFPLLFFMAASAHYPFLSDN